MPVGKFCKWEELRIQFKKSTVTIATISVPSTNTIPKPHNSIGLNLWGFSDWDRIGQVLGQVARSRDWALDTSQARAQEGRLRPVPKQYQAGLGLGFYSNRPRASGYFYPPK
ncbi:hypothetical protein U1Q18_020487 [Sarracenia purpurea var. burkii]